MTTTTFFGLFQGDYLDHEGDATCLAVFSTEQKAEAFLKLLSDQHTELKRIANDQKTRPLQAGEERVDVSDLYWDIRPIPFDPRDEEEL